MKKHLFWIDLEMTGLDDVSDRILEVAVMITDLELNVVAEYESVVFQPQEIIDGMNDWCKEHHGKSGLTAAVPTGKPISAVENDLVELAKKYFRSEDRIVLVGNSVGNDKRFIDRYLPVFAKKLHYRLVDVSSFKEIYREKYGIKFDKKNAHRALGDITESIAELRHYLSFIHPAGKIG
ncbi:MAG: oligoribonuclease [Cryobacterium sp.]|nr:oligoribonuclease [Oligoflexia bacterium]